MARSWFGGTHQDLAIRPYNFGQQRRLAQLDANVRTTFWDAFEDGAQHTDLLLDGNNVNTINSDSDGYYPRFQAPDGVRAMWADTGSGRRFLMVTTDNAVDLSEDLNTRIPTSEKGEPGGVASLDAAGRLAHGVDAALIDTGIIPEARIPDLPYVQPGDLVVNSDDHATIQDALDAIASGGHVLVPGPNRVVEVEQLVMPFRGSLHLGEGVTLRRPADSLQTGPMLVIQRHHNHVRGGGQIECLNDCPDGIVRVERTDAPCEWARLNDFHIKGPGKTTVGSTGLVFSGFATFQNRASGVTISDVETGTRHEGGANMNHLTDVTLYNIGTRVHDFDGTMESTVVGGSVSQAAGATVFTLRGGAFYMRAIGFAAEPGVGSSFWDIAAGCIDNHFLGCVDNTPTLGPNPESTRTTAILSRRTYIGDRLYVAGQQMWAPQRVSKAADEVVNNSTAYQADDDLIAALDASATYEFEVFVIYDASTSADAKFKLSTPAGATAHWTMQAAATGAPADTGSGTYGYDTEATGQAVGGGGVGTKMVARMLGQVTTTNAGDLGIEWGQVVAEASDLTVYAGSWIKATRVA